LAVNVAHPQARPPSRCGGRFVARTARSPLARERSSIIKKLFLLTVLALGLFLLAHTNTHARPDAQAQGNHPGEHTRD
jgi:hypothetical protein